MLNDPVLRDAQPGILADLAEPVGALASAARGDDLCHQVQLGTGDQPGRLFDDRRPGDLPGYDEHIRLAHPGRGTDLPLTAITDDSLGASVSCGALDDPGEGPQRPVVP